MRETWKKIADKKLPCKKIAAACLLSAVALLAGFGGTWAYYNDTMSLIYPLQTSNTSVSMVEEFSPDAEVLPGETVPKIVAFENTGDMDLFLRVEVPPEEAWYDPETKSVFSLAGAKENNKLLGSRILKGWNENWTTQTETINGEEVPAQTHDKWTEPGNEWSAVFEQTVNGETKYYRYYLKVLKAKPETVQPGDATNGGSRTGAILDYIKLDPGVSNDRHSADYSDKIYKLTFKAQAVLVEGDGPNSVIQSGVMNEWGMTVKEENGKLVWDQ